MGYGKLQWEFIQKCIADEPKTLSGKYTGKMLELGNQRIKSSLSRYLKENNTDIAGKRIAKSVFKKMGFDHTSFDMNGKDKSIKIDLSKKINIKKYKKAFDIITNSGTSEHIEPLSSQYECFLNMHLCCKVGGLFIHMVPKQGTFMNHSHYYYNKGFFRNLAKLNKYKIIFLETLVCSLDPRCFLIGACMRKMKDCEFYHNRDSIISLIHIEKKCKRTGYTTIR